MRILTPEELKDIDSVGHGKTIAGVLDDDGDTHSIWITEACLPVIRVGNSDDDKTEAYRITVRDALILADTAGLNTTANELRAKLEEELLAADRRWQIISDCKNQIDSMNIQLNRFAMWLMAAGCSDLQVQRIADGKAIESDDLSPREIGVGLELSEAKRQLEESRELFKRAQELIEKHEKLSDEQNALLAEAHQTIAQLRQADTVRPPPSSPHCRTCDCDKGWEP